MLSAPILRQITVGEAMHAGIVTCSPSAGLGEVAAAMAEHGIHCLVAIDEGPPGEDDDRLWGVVSDLDLVAAATVRSLDDQQAGGTAMAPALTAFPNESLESAAERMTTHGVSHVVVVDVSRRPVGVLSTLDLVRSLAAAEPKRRSHVSA